jgi:hypothetical protein
LSRLNKKDSREYIVKINLTSILSGSVSWGILLRSVIPPILTIVCQMRGTYSAPILLSSRYSLIWLRCSSIMPEIMALHVQFLRPWTLTYCYSSH